MKDRRPPQEGAMDCLNGIGFDVESDVVGEAIQDRLTDFQVDGSGRPINIFDVARKVDAGEDLTPAELEAAHDFKGLADEMEAASHWMTKAAHIVDHAAEQQEAEQAEAAEQLKEAAPDTA